MSLHFYHVTGLGYDLTIATRAAPDETDDAFNAVCMDEGDLMVLKGWLIEDIEEITREDAEEFANPEWLSMAASLGWPV